MVTARLTHPSSLSSIIVLYLARSPPELPPPPPLVDSRDSATPPQKLSRDSSRPSSRPTDEQLSQKRPSVGELSRVNILPDKTNSPPGKFSPAFYAVGKVCLLRVM